MITKTVLIEFANPKIRAVDHISDIREAVFYAQGNLLHRHHITLNMPIVIDGFVFVELYLPENIDENFSIGRHLRGISGYLLSKYGDFYKDYLVGARLLNYIERRSTK